MISGLECRFSEDKMAHYELFNLMPQVISANEDLQSTESTIIRVWGDLIPFSDMLSMELKRWKQHCSGITCDKSITELLAQNAVPVFFPNIREFLCTLAVLPFGSSEAERSFSCLRKVQNWLRSTMTEERLGSPRVLAIHGFKYPIDVQEVCDKLKQIHPRKITKSSLLVADANV